MDSKDFLAATVLFFGSMWLQSDDLPGSQTGGASNTAAVKEPFRATLDRGAAAIEGFVESQVGKSAGLEVAPPAELSGTFSAEPNVVPEQTQQPSSPAPPVAAVSRDSIPPRVEGRAAAEAENPSSDLSVDEVRALYAEHLREQAAGAPAREFELPESMKEAGMARVRSLSEAELRATLASMYTRGLSEDGITKGTVEDVRAFFVQRETRSASFEACAEHAGVSAEQLRRWLLTDAATACERVARLNQSVIESGCARGTVSQPWLQTAGTCLGWVDPSIEHCGWKTVPACSPAARAPTDQLGGYQDRDGRRWYSKEELREESRKWWKRPQGR